MALARGGIGQDVQTLACAWIFFALAIRFAVGWRTRDTPRLPLLGVVLLGWPLLQLVSLPSGLMAALDPQRAAELNRFAQAGISIAPTISLHPYATARILLILAAALGLFVLARDLCRRQPQALVWLAAGFIALGLVEAITGLRQYVLLQTGAVTPTGAGDDFIHGTFGNRNLLAAWLEGCYGVALAMATMRRRVAAITVLFAFAAVVLAAVVILSFSRAGILGIAAESVFWGCVAWRGSWRGPVRTAVISGALILCAGVVGWTGVTRRYTAGSLALEREGRFAMWRDSIRAIWRYPVTGAGAGAFPFAFRRGHAYLTGYTIDHAHNEYLEAAVEWGLPAVVVLMGGMALAFVRIFRGLEQQDRQRQIALGCLAGALAIALHAAVDFPLRIPAILALFCVLLGMAAGARKTAAAFGQSRRITTVGMALLWLGLGALSLWPIPASAEGHYAAGRQLIIEGRSDEAAAAFRRALTVNPYAAPVWRELAWIAESRGDAQDGLGLAELAQRLEPHTKRGEWALANSYLRFGEASKAAALFVALSHHAPELRATARDLCGRAGVSISCIDGER